jgi:hypothetical protein
MAVSIWQGILLWRSEPGGKIALELETKPPD